jgi:hypothetical protein
MLMGKIAGSLAVCVGSMAVAALVALPLPAAAQMMAPTIHYGQTPTYAVELVLGPAEQMLAPGAAMAAKSGEVIVSGGSMNTGSMASSSSMGGGSMMAAPSSTEMPVMMAPGMDQGMAVNQHVEVHIARNDTGAVVNDVTPTIRITDKTTGESRDLPQVMAMYGMQMGPSDFHYGQNVWLPDGTYSVTVMIGPETAVFRDLAVMNGSPMSMSGN